MRILQITQSLSRRAGGLFHSVRLLAHGLAAAHPALQVMAVGTRDDDWNPDAPEWAPISARACSIVGPQRLGFSLELVQALEEAHADLVHLHGVWSWNNIAVPRWASSTRRPFVLSPHGMLEPWCLRRAAWKKRLALALYQWRCLQRASAIHATCPAEARNIRALGYSGPIATIPNGVPMPPVPPRSASSGPRTVLFLSRIHPKKGLLELVEAWAQVRPAGWVLVIAGPDECGHLADVQAATAKYQLADSIRFRGPVWGSERLELYRQADLFVLPSHSENFGLVVAEALSCGIPVITTNQTPWEELTGHNCGWCIDVGVDPLVNALQAALALPPEHLADMGKRGRDLIERRYTWTRAARDMSAVYSWLLGHSPMPSCVDPAYNRRQPIT